MDLQLHFGLSHDHQRARTGARVRADAGASLVAFVVDISSAPAAGDLNPNECDWTG